MYVNLSSILTYVKLAFPPAGSRQRSGSLGGRVLRLTLVHDQEFDRARRLGALVLIAVDRSARDVDGLPCLEDPWLLALDREGDLALDDRLPLIAAVRVERIA